MVFYLYSGSYISSDSFYNLSYRKEKNVKRSEVFTLTCISMLFKCNYHKSEKFSSHFRHNRFVIYQT